MRLGRTTVRAVATRWARSHRRGYPLVSRRTLSLKRAGSLPAAGRLVARVWLALIGSGNKVESTFLTMPNQLSKSKRRQSLAEHEAVLAALAEIARREKTSVMALLRQAARAMVKQKASDPVQAEDLREVVWRRMPRMPAHFKTAAQVARFKRAQREFDQVLLDLNLATPRAIQERNSIAPSRQTIRLIDFDRAHAAAAV